MTNAIDNAIARLQDLALACTTVTIKSAPDYPITNADPAPFSIAHLQSGLGVADNASTLRLITTANVDFYFSAANLKQAYQQMDALAMEYMQRLAGDPTLNNTVDTIIFTAEQQPTFENLGIGKWGTVDLNLLRFSVPFKTLKAPIT